MPSTDVSNTHLKMLQSIPKSLTSQNKRQEKEAPTAQHSTAQIDQDLINSLISYVQGEVEYGYVNLFSFETVDQGITVINEVLRVFSFSCSVGFDRNSQSILFTAY